MISKIIILAFVLIATVTCEKKRYDGYKLVAVTPKSDADVKLIAELEKESDFDIWKDARGTEIEVLLSPIAFEKYKKIFMKSDLPFRVLISNMQNEVDNEEAQLAKLARDGRIVGTYATYTDINLWIDQIVGSNSFLSLYTIGQSYQGRDMRVVKFNVGDGSNKRAIWIDCGIHAREWVSVSTCVYIIDRLVKEYNAGNAGVTALLQYYEFHILPVLNPDGYVFSHTTDRYWRKNRRVNSGSTCFGVDLNRNFGFKWNTGGSSTDPCSDTYMGVAADSEPEVQALENAILSKKGQWDAFVTIHSYGQYFLTPFGYTQTYPNDWNDIKRVADLSYAQIKSVYNKVYFVGSASVLLYIASGSSPDWAYANATIKYAYTLELRPTNSGFTGLAGFNYDVNKSIEVGEEIYAGIIGLANETKKLNIGK